MITKIAERLVEIDMKIRNLELASIWADLGTQCLAKDEIQELEEEKERLWAQEA